MIRLGLTVTGFAKRWVGEPVLSWLLQEMSERAPTRGHGPIGEARPTVVLVQGYGWTMAECVRLALREADRANGVVLSFMGPRQLGSASVIATHRMEYAARVRARYAVGTYQRECWRLHLEGLVEEAAELALEFAARGDAAEAVEVAMDRIDGERSDLLPALVARIEAQQRRARSSPENARLEVKRWADMMERRPSAKRSAFVKSARADVLAWLYSNMVRLSQARMVRAGDPIRVDADGRLTVGAGVTIARALPVPGPGADVLKNRGDR